MLYPTELRDLTGCLFAMGRPGQDWMLLQNFNFLFAMPSCF